MFLLIDTSARQSPHYEARIWRHLWEMRDVAPVSVVLPTVVSSPCPLLPEERAGAILSAFGLPVPRNSAWIPMQIDVSRFARHNGDIRLGALEKVLYDCVERGDSLHDTQDWSSPVVGLDSWLNRRLAVAIRGWGNLVRRRGADPADLRTLNELMELADFIGNTLRRKSHALAREKGHCPAVDVAGTKVVNRGGEMKLRWQSAVEHTALRHRNLTTMSVWDVFPQGEPADQRYFDLLPLLRCANCLSFRRDVDISHWSMIEFRRFYGRVSAILRSQVTAGQIAKQV